MNGTGPLVTAIALCFNHSRFVIEALESVRTQTYLAVELVIMDDCSTDGSVALIEDWRARHRVECVFIAHRENRGLCRTLNEALRHAHGKYVAFIGTDDVWLPEKLERQVAEMEQLSEDVGVLYSDAYQIDVDGRPLPRMFIESHRRLEAMPQGQIFTTLVDGNFIPAMTALIRRNVYGTVGLYDERLCFEDWDMWLRIARRYRFAFSPYPSAKYRIVPTSMMRTVLVPENLAFAESIALIQAKSLASGWLDSERQARATRRLSYHAETLYELGHRGAARYFWLAGKHRREWRTLTFLVLAGLGVPYAAVRWLARWRGRLTELTRRAHAFQREVARLAGELEAIERSLGWALRRVCGRRP